MKHIEDKEGNLVTKYNKIRDRLPIKSIKKNYKKKT